MYKILTAFVIALLMIYYNSDFSYPCLHYGVMAKIEMNRQIIISLFNNIDHTYII